MEFIIVKFVLVVVVFLVSLGIAAYSTYAERKIAAFLQDRVGPDRAGPFGILQPLADGVKMFMKEEIIPTHADKGLFQLLRDLVIKNGQVAREYVDGKRKKYFSPLNFFLLVAAVFVFFFSLQSPPETIAPEILQNLSPQQIRGMKVGVFFNHYSR